MRQGWPRRSGAKSQWFAKRTVVDGVTFASQKEAARYQQLKMLQRAGEVLEIECHPSWSFDVNGVHIGKFTADFRVVYKTGEVTFEDVKGARQSRDYILRKKLLLAVYGLPVTEIRA